MLAGLMQTTPLRVIDILSYAAAAHGEREIVSRLVDEPLWRYNYRGLIARTARCANALKRLGARPGDRIATLCWNTHRHLELFYAAPGIGAVLHTVNPRFFEEQIAYTLDHAESRFLFFDRNFLPLVERLAPQLRHVEGYVMTADAARTTSGAIGALSYEALLGAEDAAFDWPVFDENAAAILCYTSGTTGDPKGVLYSHRAIVLHAMAVGLPGAFGLGAFDVVMPCASMYHATAWGLPYAAPLNGAKLVLPCDKMDGASLQELIAGEGVTFTGGVPTIWTMYLDHLERVGETTGALERVVIGGSAVPRAMAEKFKERHNVRVLQVWGMTETTPIGVVSTPTPALVDIVGKEALDEAIWTRAGRLQFGMEIRIAGEDGRALPHDGESAGALLVRGPWVIRRYFKAGADCADAEGWFDTGDIATVDPLGYLRITDRKKDVIKSGGEWISSIDLENVAVACPGVKLAAVVGAVHAKWEERPVLIIEPHDGAALTKEAVLGYLAPLIVKWWTPDAIFFEKIPLTATGKIDKKVLREKFRNALTG